MVPPAEMSEITKINMEGKMVPGPGSYYPAVNKIKPKPPGYSFGSSKRKPINKHMQDDDFEVKPDVVIKLREKNKRIANFI